MKKRLSILCLAFFLIFSSLSATATELPVGKIVTAEIDLFESSSPSAMLFSASDPVEDAALLIEEGIDGMAAEIVVLSARITEDNIRAAVSRATKRNPRFFYLDKTYVYRTIGSYVYSVVFTYTMTAEERAAADLQIDQEVEKAIATTHASMSDAEKALAVHDYICREFEYDSTYTNYDMYSMVRDRYAVCQAYAYLYMDILEELNIPCEFVPSDSMVHAWNLVEIDGEWYHVDVTYDDPMYDLLGLARHKFFLLDDATIQSEGYDHTGYVTSYAAEDNTYVNRAWSGIRSPFINVDGVWYTGGYQNYKTYLYSYDFSSDILTPVYEGTTWDSFSGGFYPASFMGLFPYEDTVIFNLRDGFYQYDPRDGTTQKIYDIPSEGEWVYGSRLSGDTVWYCTTVSPNHGHMNTTDADAYEVHSISLGEIAPCDAILSVEVSEGESLTDGTVYVNNGTHMGEARLIVAGYGERNCLGTISVIPVTLTLRTAQEIPFTLTGTDFERVQAFLFTPDGITPLGIYE